MYLKLQRFVQHLTCTNEVHLVNSLDTFKTQYSTVHGRASSTHLRGGVDYSCIHVIISSRFHQGLCDVPGYRIWPEEIHFR